MSIILVAEEALMKACRYAGLSSCPWRLSTSSKSPSARVRGLGCCGAAAIVGFPDCPAGSMALNLPDGLAEGGQSDCCGDGVPVADCWPPETKTTGRAGPQFVLAAPRGEWLAAGGGRAMCAGSPGSEMPDCEMQQKALA